MSADPSLVGEKPEGAYAPGPVEARWLAYWRAHDLFRADADSGREPFTILIPPPNVTGSLHIGHCLNNAIQDVIIRHRRMRGYEALWLPGTDHAGIATQNVVEKKLLAAGKTRHDLGRDAFLAEVWRWKEEQHDRIVSQLDALGCSCDWSRERFTLDPGLSRAVRKVFVALHAKGLIYRGDYIVNWCPRCHTALSDEEVEHEEVRGTLTTIRYPLAAGGGSIAVATTRPETMLGDTAVAVHPEDARYRHLIGTSARASAPRAGDPDRRRRGGGPGVRHRRGQGDAGARSERLPDRGAARAPGAQGHGRGRADERERRPLRRPRPLRGARARGGGAHARGSHRRGQGTRARGRPLPALRDGDRAVSLAAVVRAHEAARGARDRGRGRRSRALPSRALGQASTATGWRTSATGASRASCGGGIASRSGTCAACGELIVSEEDPTACPACGGAALEQDEDVLDTWFSSWLWPFSTLGWPERTRDLQVFYPTHFLSTGPDIIFFWVARMIMAGLEFMGEVPFADVNFHAIVRDGQGRKMSKSLGNSPDPLAIIAEHGADALRFTLMYLAPTGQDQLLFDSARIETGRVFANKVWNAAKLVIGNLDGVKPGAAPHPEDLTLEDRWIRSRLALARDLADEGLTGYRIQEAAKAVYEFFWHEFCDWYLELAKIRLYGSDEKARNTARLVAYEVLEASLRLLHPIMPFLTEDLWQRLPHEGVSIARAPWPAPGRRDLEAEADMEFLKQAIVAVRTIRAEMNVPPGREAEVIAHAGGRVAGLLAAAGPKFATLARARLAVDPAAVRPAFAAAAIVGDAELFVPLKGLIDLDVERRRLEKERARVEKEWTTAVQRLDSKEFLERAPAAVVARERERLAELGQTRDKLARNLAALGAGAD